MTPAAPAWPPALPSTGDVWLRNARVPAVLAPDRPPGAPVRDGLAHLDIRVDAGRIAALLPAGTGPGPEGADLDGGQVWPGLVDAHTHLDKGHILPRAPNPDGTFPAALAATRADREARWSEADMEARAEFALRCALAHGTAALRTHLDTELPRAEASWRMFRRLRDRWAGRIDLQATSLTALDGLDGEAGVRIADLVAASGGQLGAVTALGGPAGAPPPPGFAERLDRLLDLAAERDLDLDLHLDESGAPGARALRHVAEAVLRRGFRGRVLCGHCCSLSVQPEEEAAETIALCAAAGLAVAVLPLCNAYLQDRHPGRTPRWRGVTLAREMDAAGIPVLLASDNARDPFHAYGDLDLLEVFRESVRLLHLDHPVGDWPAAVAARAAAVLRLPGHGTLRPGAPADLVLFRGRGWSELLSRPQSDRVVLRAGRRLDAPLPDWRELDALVGGAGGGA